METCFTLTNIFPEGAVGGAVRTFDACISRNPYGEALFLFFVTVAILPRVSLKLLSGANKGPGAFYLATAWGS